MIGASVLLLVGLVGPFESDESLAWQAAVPARPVPAATPLTRAVPKRGRRVRAIQRRPKTNDITETLRAMNLMQIGVEPAPAQGSGRNN